ncbi:MAG: M20/M25/M40 family metallo-hydrolase [Pseudomonadota bacterium]
MTPSSNQLDPVLQHIDDNADDRLTRLFDFLRIKSISTDPAYSNECADAADGLSSELNQIGFKSRVVQTEGHPIVLAHKQASDPKTPHILFYGHYDVQPVDPLALWKSDPFDPQVIQRDDGTSFIRARGASDDKGQLRTFLEACRAWQDVADGLPCTVTVFIEGEEETGAPSMPQFLKTYGDELKRADFAVACDTSMWERSAPAIVISLRGLVSGELTLKGPSRDLHSGLYGGAARNPIHVLSNILGRLWDENGRVMLDGFYDDINDVDGVLKETLSRIDFDEAAFLNSVGLSESAGENNCSVLEKIWLRPTAEINGISGGYNGAGFKTVIPSEASAKISFRLVPGQDPDRVWSSFEEFVRLYCPKDVEASFTKIASDAAHAMCTDHAALRQASQSLSDEWGQAPLLMGIGGSIPVVKDIKRHLGLETILVGFALDDDAIHSPNEKYELESFEKGTRSWARILSSFSRTQST